MEDVDDDDDDDVVVELFQPQNKRDNVSKDIFLLLPLNFLLWLTADRQ